MITKRVKKETQPGWITDKILENINRRDSSKRNGNHNAYKHHRNTVTKLINKAKTDYYKTYVENSENNPGKLSKLFKELSGKNSNTNTITSITLENATITSEHDIANAFNEHFTNIADKYLNASIDNINWEPTPTLADFINCRVPPNNNFQIPPITEQFVAKFLSKLDIKKSTGLDNLGANILKMTSLYITHTITHICNLSIKTNTFPDVWKEAKIIPLFKKNSTQDLNNYRPISILPILSKILEKHVALYLYQFLHSHELLTSRQSGFRAKHSCETALHQMLDEWLTDINKQESVGILFVDFSKAFDLVDVKILLKKLKAYKLGESALQWFASYMGERKQRVKINATYSQNLLVKSGVPQGSILGPLLFLIYINDLPLQPTLNTTSMFADDATSSASGKTPSDVEQKLQLKALNMENWCTSNKMVLNVGKTKVMLLTSKQKLNRQETTPSLNVMIQGKSLIQVKCEKLLGVQIDQSLSWDEQIKKQKQTILFKITLLKKIKTYLPLSTRKIFYNFYIKPHFEYCNTIWINSTETNLNKISKLQKYAARVILDEKLQRENTTPSNVLFQRLDWINFKQNARFRQALLVFKSLNNLTPQYMRDMFKYVHEIIPRTLRSSAQNKLHQPAAHPKSIRFNGPKIWNSLNYQVRNAKSVEQFKKLYKIHCLEQ